MNTSGLHIALLCNPTADNEKSIRLADTLVLLLEERKIAYTLFTTYWPQVWSGITHAWIIGGDGTLHYFINTYPDIELPLAVFPGGSGNDFCWMLYGDLKVEQLLERVLRDQRQAVDAGRCNGRLFLVGLGVGFDGAIVQELLGRKKQAGKASYLLAVLRQIARFSERDCTIRLPDEEVREECLMISVANVQRYGGGYQVAPHARLNDGLLDVSIIGRIPPLRRLKYLPMIEKGEHISLPFVRYTTAGQVEIRATGPVPAHLDGEFLLTDRFVVESLPKRFLFCV